MEATGPGGVGVQRLVPAQVHVNGDLRPGERETDILDDEVLLTGGHALRSADSLGTLSSSCHKSSQNSLLSDGFGSPGGEDPLQQGPALSEEYERAYAEARRGFLGQRSVSVASSAPAGAGPKQQVYRQGSYSTHTWVRQQQMVAAQQYAYMAEEGKPRDPPKTALPSEHQAPVAGPRVMSPEPPATVTTGAAAAVVVVNNNNNSNNKTRDEEFNSLTVDIDNSIDQLNQLIMDLDPTFTPLSTRSGSVRRGPGPGEGHVNGTASSWLARGPQESSAGQPAQSVPQSAVQSGELRGEAKRGISRQDSDTPDHTGFCSASWGVTDDYRSPRTYSSCGPLSQHGLLYRSDSVNYRSQGPDMDSGVEAGSDMCPPTPAFPISPPTPYVKNTSEFNLLRQTPSPTMHSYGGYRTEHESLGYSDMIGHVGQDPADSAPHYHRLLSSSRSASLSGPLQRTNSPSMGHGWPDQTRPALGSYPTPRQPLVHSVSLDYGHHSPPPTHLHPAPNAHSSPRGGHTGRYAFHHSPAQSFHEQDDSGPAYGVECPSQPSSLLGDGGLLPSMEVRTRGQQGPVQPPLLPEKRRASDGEHSLGTASPAPSGFSSPHSGSSLSIPFPNVLPDLSAMASGMASQLPDVLAGKQLTVKFVQDTSKFWYKPEISRDQAIAVLRDQEPGCFIVRDSHSFRGAYGLAMKVATPPPSVLQQGKKGGDLSNELVRHFLIECSQKGVRLKGCPNEPYFGSLTALVCQHSITPLALPCKLIIPDRDPLEDVVECNTSLSVTNSAAELLKQGAACNVWFLGSVEMESLTGIQAVQKATSMTLSAEPQPTSTVVHFKVSSQGITLTDNQRKLFFRRHYAVNVVIFCALDPQDRKWSIDGCASAKIFGFVARKTGSAMDNVCHLFAEHDPEQPASAIVNFVSKVMIGSHKCK